MTLAPELPGALGLVDHAARPRGHRRRRSHRRHRRGGPPRLRPRRPHRDSTCGTPCARSLTATPGWWAPRWPGPTWVSSSSPTASTWPMTCSSSRRAPRRAASRPSPTRSPRPASATAAPGSAPWSSRSATGWRDAPTARWPAARAAWPARSAGSARSGWRCPTPSPRPPPCRRARPAGATSACSQPGARADLVVLDDRLEVVRVLCRGEPVG